MIRIVTVKPDAPYTLEPDEVILEKRTSYGEDVCWHLLVQKGGAHEPHGFHAARDAEREAKAAERGARVMAAFADALVAFGAGLAEPDESVYHAEPAAR